MAAVFLGSFVAAQDFPNRKEPRIAFLGRSNVGKSALINLLTGTRIANVSKTPGRTQTLNVFLIDNQWIFGDFPGYGFAKVSKEQKRNFESLVRKFLTTEFFDFAIQIVDARHPGMDSDLQLQEWLHASGLPNLIVFNKSDKLNQSERAKAERQARELFPGQPLVFVSTVTKEGKHELEKRLHQSMSGASQKAPARSEL